METEGTPDRPTRIPNNARGRELGRETEMALSISTNILPELPYLPINSQLNPGLTTWPIQVQN